jgi:16S rRNA (cytidine1402-2'-O)-methyltransferase
VCAEPGTLWIVATPIGTLGDISQRAREVLGSVDLILAEDTRRARRLLSHLEVLARGRLRSLHEHNEKKRVPSLVESLREGRSIALISDAGTPVLSDPGYLLVRKVRAEALPVCSVPGASAFTAALAAAGQPPLPATRRAAAAAGDLVRVLATTAGGASATNRGTRRRPMDHRHSALSPQAGP